MLDDIRIDEAGNETFTNERFAQPLSQLSGDVGGCALGFGWRSHAGFT
jgi:hypothetical protein